MQKTYIKYFELVFWLTALISLALMTPGIDAHYSLCVFKLLGLNFCPGCGLGHSISYLFHGDMEASIAAHPLGVFAVLIIVCRIYKLLQLHLFTKKLNNHYGI
ncbi:MAG TPA: DUF2752 domain-containing protein [Chitinophagaceae bacterium]|nr:DUF2752 domain-containing protein [Chitinophagaceae bacterium]